MSAPDRLSQDELDGLLADERALRDDVEGVTDPFFDHTFPDEGLAPGASGKRNTARELVRLAEEHFEIGRSSDGGESVAFARSGPNLAVSLTSDTFKNLLSRRYFDQHGTPPARSAIADALGPLTAVAATSPIRPLATRVARYETGVLIDLGDETGATIAVGPGGWTVWTRSPIPFRRTALTAPMPRPTSGGSVKELRDLLNVSDEGWPLLLGWLLSAFLPGWPHPVALLDGEQGTGKSTAAQMLVQLVDPSTAPLRSAPRKLDDWIIGASGSWVVCVDNLSQIPHWFSDALCRAATGEGLVRRQLFTDAELHVISMRRCILLTSIALGSLRGDLADRLLAIELERIDPTSRMGEADLARRFEEARPRILGGLLDLLSRVFAAWEKVSVPEVGRMADFCHLLAVLDRIEGTDALDSYRAQGVRLNVDVVDGDPVGSAIKSLLAHTDHWTGTATDLLAALAPLVPSNQLPATAHGLSGELKRMAPPLARIGIEVRWPKRTATTRRLELLRVGDAHDADDALPSIP